MKSRDDLGDKASAVVGVLLSALAVLLVAAGLLSAAGTAAGGWPWLNRGAEHKELPPEVTTEQNWLASHVGGRDLVVVDARPSEAYGRGHIPTAISIPPGELPMPPDLSGALAERGLSGAERIVCYGADAYSSDAATLLWMLELAGAGRASVLDGGLAAWRGAGRNTTAERAALPETTWEPEPRPRLFADTDYVEAHYGETGYEIVDARGRDAWARSLPEGTEGGRVGHIPHSLPFDFRTLLGADGFFLPVEITHEILAELGPRPSTVVDLADEFIVHGDGTTGEGALGYFLMRRAGVGNVVYYPEGWLGWSADESLPVVRLIMAEELMDRLDRERRLLRPDGPPKQFVLFDVRHFSAYDGGRGHIPGAVSLSSSQFADSLEVYLERHWPGIDRAETPIVTYCYGEHCIRSRYTSTYSARAGFLKVERLFGGLSEWRGVGGEVAHTPPSE